VMLGYEINDLVYNIFMSEYVNSLASGVLS